MMHQDNRLIFVVLPAYANNRNRPIHINFVVAGLSNKMCFKRGSGCGCFYGGCDGGKGALWRSWRFSKTNPFTAMRPSIAACISEEEQFHVPLSFSRPTFVSSLVEDPFVLLCLRQNRSKSSMLKEERCVAAVSELAEQIDFFDPAMQQEQNQLKYVSLTEEVDYSMLPKYLQLESHGQGDSKCLESTWVTEFTKGESQGMLKQTFTEKTQEAVMDHNRHHFEGFVMHQSLARDSDEWEAGDHGEGIVGEDDHQYILLSASSECIPEDMYFSSPRVHDSLSGMDALSELDEDPYPFVSLCSRKQPVENLPASASDFADSSYSKQAQVEARDSQSSVPSHEPSTVNDGVMAIIMDQDVLAGNYNSQPEQDGATARRVTVPVLNPNAIKVFDEVKYNIVDHEDENTLDELNAILDEEDDFRCSKESTDSTDVSMFFEAGESGRTKESSIYEELTKLLFQEAPGSCLDELIKKVHQYEEEMQNIDAQVTHEERKVDRGRRQPVKKEVGTEDDLIGKTKEKLASLMDSIKGPIEQKMEVPTIHKDMWLSIEKNLDSLLFPEFQSSTRHAVTSKMRKKHSRRSKAKREYNTYRENTSLPVKSKKSKMMYCYEQVNGVPVGRVETVEKVFHDASLPVKSKKSKVMYCYEQVNGVPCGRVETVEKLFDDIVTSSSSSSKSSTSSSLLSSLCNTGESTVESDLGDIMKGSITDNHVGPEDEIMEDTSRMDIDAGPEDEIRQDINVIKLFWRYDDNNDDEQSTEDPSTDYTSTTDEEQTTRSDQKSLSTTKDFSVSTDKSQARRSNLLGGKLIQQESSEQETSQTRQTRSSKLLHFQTRHETIRSSLRRLPSKFRHLLVQSKKVPVTSIQ